VEQGPPLNFLLQLLHALVADSEGHARGAIKSSVGKNHNYTPDLAISRIDKYPLKEFVRKVAKLFIVFGDLFSPRRRAGVIQLNWVYFLF